MIAKIPCISWELEYVLRALSLWPEIYNIPAGFILCSTWITIVPFQFVHIMGILDAAVELMAAICDIVSLIAILLQLFIAWLNRKTLMSLIIEMDEDWKLSGIKITPETKTSCFIARLDIYLHCGVAVMFCPKFIAAYFNKSPENREYLLKTSYPFEDYKTPVYETIIISQFLQGIFISAADVMPQALLVALVCHAGTQFDVLERQFNRLTVNAVDKHQSGKKFSAVEDLYKRHNKAIYFAGRIEDVFSNIALIHCLCNVVTIGCSGLVFTVSKDPVDIGRFSIYVLLKLVHTFVLCYAGEYLTNKSVAIADIVYDTDWCDMDPKHAKIFQLMILRSQKTLALTAGKFSELSSGMFTDILKMSGSYMSVLRATY